ncbi:MAG TPA: recombinase family protein [Chloroflexota bacterium]|nr:recombinase family protein [Chloroflexota bacterium]
MQKGALPVTSLLDLDAARTRRHRKGAGPLVYPTDRAWNGQIAELYKRNSDPRQIDNERAEFQEQKTSHYLLELGYAVRVNDEQGTSGGRLSARKVMQAILERLISGESHRLAVTELSRLTRDERQLDPAYIAWVITEHCSGRLLTLGREWNLYDSSDRRQYDIDTMLAGWRRQDDKEKSLQGMQQYIERVIRGERPVTMPSRLKYGYRRIPTGFVDRNGRAERHIERDPDYTQAFDAIRAAFNANRSVSAAAAELNRLRIPAPYRTVAPEYAWQPFVLRRMIESDWYAGVWKPFNQLRRPLSWRAAVPTFDPLAHEREEPTLAWFTKGELAAWRIKFLDHAPIRRVRHRRNTDDTPPLLDGLLHCAVCAEANRPKHHMVLGGTRLAGRGRGRYTLYTCANSQTTTITTRQCTTIGEPRALRALLDLAPVIQSRTTDVVTRIHVLVAGCGAADLQRRRDAIAARRRYLKEEWIDGMKRPDPEIKQEYTDLGDELLAIETQLSALNGETETIKRAAQVMALLGGDLKAGLQMLATPAQALVLSALVAEAHVSAQGRGWDRTVTITKLRTTAELHALATPNSLQITNMASPKL